MQKSNRNRSLAVRVGALTAALSLMFAGGVAMASSAAAANNNNNGNGAASQTKPKPNANPNNPQKNDPNGTTGSTDNGTKPGNDTGSFGPSGSKNDAFEPGKKVYVCHADTNNGNAQNAANAANGGGNNLGQNGGGNTHAGFSIIYISWQAWLSNHDRLHENDRYFETREAAEGYCGGGGETYYPTAQACAVLKTGGTYATVTFKSPVEVPVGQTPAVAADWIAQTPATGVYGDYTVDATQCGGGDTYFPTAQACAVLTTGGTYATVTFKSPTAVPVGQTPAVAADWIAQTPATGVYGDYTVDATQCGGGDFPSQMTAELCEVNGNAYAKGKVVSDPYREATQPMADQKAIDNAVQKLKDAVAANDKVIVPPFGGYSHNWAGDGPSVFNAGCVLPPGETVQSVALAAPGTVAPAAGKPNPAKVQTPASATLPGSVPAGDGSSAPAVPFWALAMVIVGALGAAAAGSQLLGSRK